MYEDDTGLIYMRARYYSPTLRRFVNADKVHGDISNALTLNRYAFVNGNPAVNVDPEGLSAERGNNPYGDIYRAYFGSEYAYSKKNPDISWLDILDMYIRMYNPIKYPSKEFGKAMLGRTLSRKMESTLHMICSHIESMPISVTNGVEQTIPFVSGSEIYYSFNHSKGDGNIDISAVMSEFESISFSTSINDYTKIVTNIDEIGVSYSQNISRNSSISASIFFDTNLSVSADYTLSTTYGGDESMSATVGIRKSIFSNPTPLPESVPEFGFVPIPDLNFANSNPGIPVPFIPGAPPLGGGNDDERLKVYLNSEIFQLGR